MLVQKKKKKGKINKCCFILYILGMVNNYDNLFKKKSKIRLV